MSPHVWSVPMTTRFRGITVREGVLLEGPGGWGEWSQDEAAPREQGVPKPQ